MLLMFANLYGARIASRLIFADAKLLNNPQYIKFFNPRQGNDTSLKSRNCKNLPKRNCKKLPKCCIFIWKLGDYILILWRLRQSVPYDEIY